MKLFLTKPVLLIGACALLGATFAGTAAAANPPPAQDATITAVANSQQLNDVVKQNAEHDVATGAVHDVDDGAKHDVDNGAQDDVNDGEDDVNDGAKNDGQESK